MKNPKHADCKRTRLIFKNGFKETYGEKIIHEYKWEDVQNLRIEEHGDIETICFDSKKAQKRKAINSIYKVNLEKLLLEFKSYQKQKMENI